MNSNPILASARTAYWQLLARQDRGEEVPEAEVASIYAAAGSPTPGQILNDSLLVRYESLGSAAEQQIPLLEAKSLAERRALREDGQKEGLQGPFVYGDGAGAGNLYAKHPQHRARVRVLDKIAKELQQHRANLKLAEKTASELAARRAGKAARS